MKGILCALRKFLDCSTERRTQTESTNLAELRRQILEFRRSRSLEFVRHGTRSGESYRERVIEMYMRWDWLDISCKCIGWNYIMPDENSFQGDSYYLRQKFLGLAQSWDILFCTCFLKLKPEWRDAEHLGNILQRVSLGNRADLELT